MMRGFWLVLLAVFSALSIRSALAETTFPVYGANGDAGATDRCPAGTYFVGVIGKTGLWVDQITVYCAPRKPDGSIGIAKSIASRGGPGGGLAKAMCGKDEVITGIVVARTKDYQVRGVDMTCKNVKDGSTHQIYLGGTAKMEGNGGVMACGPSEAAAGMVIRYGKYVNGLGLICNDIASSVVSGKDFCGAYAEAAVWQVKALQTNGCGNKAIGGRWNDNFQVHKDACFSWPKKAQTNNALAEFNARGQALSDCRASGLGISKETNSTLAPFANHPQASTVANKDTFCTNYAKTAVAQVDYAQNQLKCKLSGPRWTPVAKDHFKACMGWPKWGESSAAEQAAREYDTLACKRKVVIAREAHPNTGGGAGGEAPPEWREMLAAHNDFRKKHCSPPLQWDAGLASAAQDYAQHGALGAHGASNENLATRYSVNTNSAGVSTDVLPGGTDTQAFQEVWACEEKYYHYDDPFICPGFKHSCDEPKPECKNSNPVTGHYTQVVWKSATKVGCGRFNREMMGDDGKMHQGTNWVCRYDTGNDGAAAVLRQNVMPEGCVPQGLRRSRAKRR